MNHTRGASRTDEVNPQDYFSQLRFVLSSYYYNCEIATNSPSRDSSAPERSELAKQIPQAAGLFFPEDCFETRNDRDQRKLLL